MSKVIHKKTFRYLPAWMFGKIEPLCRYKSKKTQNYYCNYSYVWKNVTCKNCLKKRGG